MNIYSFTYVYSSNCFCCRGAVHQAALRLHPDEHLLRIRVVGGAVGRRHRAVVGQPAARGAVRAVRHAALATVLSQLTSSHVHPIFITFSLNSGPMSAPF